MLFPFLTLPDGTEVVYSEILHIDGKDCVKVMFERWNDEHDDFDSMECLLPNGEMTNVVGFTDKEVSYQHSRMIKLQNMILECSHEDTEEYLCQS